MPLEREVEYPDHYTTSKLQPVDVIDAWHLNFNLGNTIKYICRYPHKGNPLRDLQKAQWYLTREISKLEARADDIF